MSYTWPRAYCKLTIYAGPTIVAGFGYDVPTTQLLNMGSGASQVAGTFLALFVAKKTSRTFAAIFTLFLACVGCAMMLGIPSSNTGARYGGYVLVYQCKRSRLRPPSYSYSSLIENGPHFYYIYHHFYVFWGSWEYQEICFRLCLPTRLCSWQYHWPSNIQSQGCAQLLCEYQYFD